MPPEQRKSGIATKIDGLKAKDLVGIPWRVALALQADGWWLRQDIIWHKPNPMPESVRDRCTKAHEYVFLLTKSDKYFYDADAVSEASVEMSRPQSEKRRLQRMNRGVVTAGRFGQTSKGVDSGEEPTHVMRSGERRNRRSVWTVTTKPFRGAHFAVMPPDLAELCIKAGTSEEGCCDRCGDPWSKDKKCRCEGSSPTPCTVMDPFAGSGTTMAVAASLGRSSVGCELNPEYIKIAQARIGAAVEKAGLFA
jgi:DNA modification methylase